MKHCRTYRFRMVPTPSQRQALEYNAGCRRWVWNWALSRKQKYYSEHGVGLATRILQSELPVLKHTPGTTWLAQADAQSLQEVLRNLDNAFRLFFNTKARMPRFKARKDNQFTFSVPQRVIISNGYVRVPKIGHIKIRQSCTIEGPTKSATFKRDSSGDWYVTFTTELAMPDTPLPNPNASRTVGVDLGLKDFAVLNNGEREPIPRFARKAERLLRRAQRTFCRRKKNSARRLRGKRIVALVNRKITNQRQDFLHKLTTRLVRDYEGVCIEDLNIKGLARTKLAKSILDAGFGEFRRQLEYKTIWNRRYLAVIDRWFPSSKTCHVCGVVNQALTLADRSWTCVCGACHDRDLNAAINIRSEGLRILAAGHAESLNARGPDVRLPLEAIGDEA